MGIDLHNLQLLAHARGQGASFARTIGIGRQALFIDAPDLERHRLRLGLPPLAEPARPRGAPRYFEPLLQQWLGAECVDSVDASPYEAATIVHDLNRPWPEGDARRGSYDAVLDFGCLEHVFDFAVAWRNCAALCRVGGHVLHSLPANNLSGHGFYQFSPELFFNLYRPQNGFALRGLWFALKADLHHWWQVADPIAVRRRVTLCNAHEVYMLVLAQKLAEIDTIAPPQQSDYAGQAWLAGEPAGAADAVEGRATAAILDRLGLLDAARGVREWLRVVARSGRSLPAPDYRRIVVAELLRRDAP